MAIGDPNQASNGFLPIPKLKLNAANIDSIIPTNNLSYNQYLSANNQSMAGAQLQDYKSLYNPDAFNLDFRSRDPRGEGNFAGGALRYGLGKYGKDNNNNTNQKTEIGMFGEGGYLDLGSQAVGAGAQLYGGIKAAQLGAADLDFRRESFNTQVGNQVALLNNQMFDTQRRRNLESGMNVSDAEASADRYVTDRGAKTRQA